MTRARCLVIAALLVAGMAGCQSQATPAHDSASRSVTDRHPASRPARVLLVCNGSTRPCPAVPHYRTVQAAVNAARPGDWVLIWPGVYHEKNGSQHAGVWVTTPHLHIRGLDRAQVV